VSQILRWHVYPDTADLASHGAQAIVRASREAIAARGTFHLVLAGGETPLAIYERLCRAEADWSAWHLYFGDERCRPRGDPVRNDTRIAGCWFAHVPIPPAQIHPIPAELGPEAAAAAYAQTLAPVGEFDLVLLGLGEDGHTASLFPGPVLDFAREADVLPVRDAPKPPSERVSLSAPRLSRTRQVLFFVQGVPKRAAVAAWRRGEDIPARRIAPPHGVDVLLDAQAMDLRPPA
jgi:6-phosphogluconolactonase